MKEIKGYEGLYSIDKEGNIFGHKLGSFLSLKNKNCRYLHVNLCREGIKKTFNIHRLVALTYIPNPDNYPQVNHINGIKRDNRVENLEWVTGTQNVVHAYKNGLISKKINGIPRGKEHWAFGKIAHNAKKVKNLTTGEVFESITDASNKLFLLRECVRDCVNGKQKTTGGFEFSYYDSSL